MSFFILIILKTLVFVSVLRYNGNRWEKGLGESLLRFPY